MSRIQKGLIAVKKKEIDRSFRIRSFEDLSGKSHVKEKPRVRRERAN